MSIMNTTFYSGKYKKRPGIMCPQKEIQIPTLPEVIFCLEALKTSAFIDNCLDFSNDNHGFLKINAFEWKKTKNTRI